MFRVLLVGGLFVLAHRVGGVERQAAYVAAAVVGAVVFSAVHHLGPLGDPFTLSVFTSGSCSGSRSTACSSSAASRSRPGRTRSTTSRGDGRAVGSLRSRDGGWGMGRRPCEKFRASSGRPTGGARRQRGIFDPSIPRSLDPSIPRSLDAPPPRQPRRPRRARRPPRAGRPRAAHRPLDDVPVRAARGRRGEPRRDDGRGGPVAAGGPVYSRLHSPTVGRFELGLAAVEGAEAAVAFGSGMAAITAALLAAREEGRAHVVGVRPIYGNTDRLLSSGLLGLDVTWTDEAGVAGALRDDTALVCVETPVNPTLDLVDVAAVAEAAGTVPVLVDSTFGTPVLQRPLALGAALVMHSATKFIGGHGDVLAGVVAGSEAWAARLRRVRHPDGRRAAPPGRVPPAPGPRHAPAPRPPVAGTATALAARLAEHDGVGDGLPPEPRARPRARRAGPADERARPDALVRGARPGRRGRRARRLRRRRGVPPVAPARDAGREPGLDGHARPAPRPGSPSASSPTTPGRRARSPPGSSGCPSGWRRPTTSGPTSTGRSRAGRAAAASRARSLAER